MSEYEIKNYLIEKYIELEFLDKKLIKSSDYWFDPNIYPINGYIPVCAQCHADFENFKTQIILEKMEVEMKHPNSCLWFDFFAKKIKISCPSAKIVRKKERK